MRTFHLTGELIAVTRLYVTIISAQFTNFLRKIIPRTYPFIAEMIDTLTIQQVLFDYVIDQSSQISGISRSAYLIKNHFQ